MRSLPPSSRRVLLTLALASSLLAPGLSAVETDITAIYAATANNYQRTRGTDGKFTAETYAFADGGRIDGTYVDESMEGLTFLKVAGTVAGALANQNYVPSRKATDTKLMIVLFWGTTMGADAGQYSQHVEGGTTAVNTLARIKREINYRATTASNPDLPDPSGSPEALTLNAAVGEMEMQVMMNNAANQLRDRNNRRNAAITGFYEEYTKAMDLPLMVGISDSIIEELEADRYFVVLKAYDFQALRKNRQKVLLWETRFSVRQRNNRFDTMLPIMAHNASKYFGQQSGRLLREVVPVGRVEVGTPTVVQTSAER